MNEISFRDDMSECGSLLNFYVPVTFDPDAVFGTNVATSMSMRILIWMLVKCVTHSL